MAGRLRPPHPVQVLLDPALEYFREAALGARHYGFETGRLRFADAWLPHELRGDMKDLIRRDGIRGIVAPLHTITQAKRFTALGVPVVNISNAFVHPRLAVVTQNDRDAGRLALRHLHMCGCRSFGFWGVPGMQYSQDRLAGFRMELQCLDPNASLSVGGGAEKKMSKWLSALPRPAGVFAVLDSFALALMRAAKALQWRIPEDLAVLGAGDDHFWVEFESTPLSSVRLPARQIGYEAARLLDRLIGGASIPSEPLRLPVVEVVARQSTDVRFVEDLAVAKAIEFIRAHAHENPYVADVAKAAGLSRTGLGVRFRKSLGHSILDEIARARIAKAQELLRDTTLKLGDVASRCGFPNSQRFSVLFRQHAGLAPRAWRKSAKRQRAS